MAYGAIDLVAYYHQSEENRVTAEQLGGIVRCSQEKQRYTGRIPSYATTFFWQVINSLNKFM